MEYDFETVIDRRETGSLKWELYKQRDVLPLWVADMDFKSAPEIVAALHARLNHQVFGYTIPDRDVVRATLAYLEQRHGLSAEKQWLHWVPGLVPALNVACRAVGKAGDAVMVCTPVYPPFLSAPINQDRELIKVPLCRRNGRWTFDFDAMEAAVTPRTRLFILCNPHNPVGRVFSKEELLALAAFCDRHDLVLCSDEIHCDLILDAVNHVATATLSKETASRTISLFAPSKTYNLPGLCCAYAVISDGALRAAFARAAAGLITEVNCFGYAGCTAAYEHGEPWRQSLLAILRQNRDRIFAFVENRVPGVTIYPMEATYLAWIDFRRWDVPSVTQHLESHGLGLSDGRLFGDPGWARLNFGCPPAVLEEALTRLERAASAVPSLKIGQ